MIYFVVYCSFVFNFNDGGPDELHRSSTVYLKPIHLYYKYIYIKLYRNQHIMNMTLQRELRKV